MIFGIGTDIISLERIEKSLERNGEKFAERILTETELEEYRQLSEQHPNNKVAFLAKRFAAKEAISKALGTGMRKGIDFVQLSIVHDALGKPLVALSGKAEFWAKQNHIQKVQVTISDEKSYALAFALAEC
ncbi:holo-ACP synthase [Kangiella sp. HZ709]|uniref:holo-ACP synthase n=1 Tax=Kangiella sp. HZ709 TaxID=2666328 RepID=UPI0012AF4605|nr:holo-ACP synthase [Kangiella sp. HZ709]MRX27342.1 holo-ACP synthase [Kangiella sp. HZ709]